MSDYPLLDTIDDPSDLRRLDRKQLPALAAELRRFIIESVASTGGGVSALPAAASAGTYTICG